MHALRTQHCPLLTPKSCTCPIYTEIARFRPAGGVGCQRLRASRTTFDAKSATLLHAISNLSDADQSRLLLIAVRRRRGRSSSIDARIQAAQMHRAAVDRQGGRDRQRAAERRAGRRHLRGCRSIEDASAILDAMPADEAQGARRLMSYPTDSAGGLMITEYLSYRDNLPVATCSTTLRAHADRYRSFDVQYAYVVADGGKLVGVLRLRDLLLSAPTELLIVGMMIHNPLKVRDTAGLEDLGAVLSIVIRCSACRRSMRMAFSWGRAKCRRGEGC